MVFRLVPHNQTVIPLQGSTRPDYPIEQVPLQCRVGTGGKAGQGNQPSRATRLWSGLLQSTIIHDNNKQRVDDAFVPLIRHNLPSWKECWGRALYDTCAKVLWKRGSVVLYKRYGHPDRRDRGGLEEYCRWWWQRHAILALLSTEQGYESGWLNKYVTVDI